ncbi:MAG: myxosortase family intramembrane protease [Kofleriaceae bacterium]
MTDDPDAARARDQAARRLEEATPLDPVAVARQAQRDALVTYAIVAVLVALLVQIDVTLPAIGHLGSALVAVLFLYAPVYVAWRRKEELDDYGFHAEPLKKGLAFTAVGFLVVFPLFIVGYLAFYTIACDTQLAQLLPRGTCSSFGGLDALRAPTLTRELIEFCAVQLVVVALPEELFFRGFLLGKLERAFPPKRRFLGGGIGWALIISSALFALIHIPKDGDPRALATFVPALMFGWMRSATGSILAPTLVHAGSNILIRFLGLMFMR